MANIVPITDLTQASLDGSGIFDVLMRANKEHLEAEFNKGRIKGTEYATVYLGSLDAVMNTALQFLLQRQEVALKAELMQQQILVAQAEVQKANAQVLIANAEVEKVRAEVQIAQAQVLKITEEIEILKLNKDKIPAEIAHLQAQTAVANQQKLNLESDKLLTISKTALTDQQQANAVIEGTVLQAQKCKLDAEFDLLKEQLLKAGQETSLLAQKVVTERAQVSGVGVDDNSVIGKQKRLYQAQTDGFQRDAEQKAAKLMVDSWSVQRTTDEGIGPPPGLANGNIDRAVNKLLTGVGA